MHKDWDEILKSKLEGNEVKPSPAVWQKIETGLSGKKKPFPFWIPATAAAIAILVWFIIPKNGEINQEKHIFSSGESSQRSPNLGAEVEKMEKNKEDSPALPSKKNDSPLSIKKQGNTRVSTQAKKAIDEKKGPKEIENAGIEKINTPAENLTYTGPILPETKIESPNLPNENETIAISSATHGSEGNEKVSQAQPLLSGLLDVAEAIFGLDTQWEETTIDNKKTVSVGADLGFISFKKKSTYRNN